MTTCAQHVVQPHARHKLVMTDNPHDNSRVKQYLTLANFLCSLHAIVPYSQDVLRLNTAAANVLPKPNRMDYQLTRRCLRRRNAYGNLHRPLDVFVGAHSIRAVDVAQPLQYGMVQLM